MLFVPKAPTTTPPTKKPKAIPKPPESPPQKMPKEIKIAPGTPDSIFSAISGATGLPPDHLDRAPNSGRSMFKSFLPEMSSDAEDSSMDRSIFNWTSFPTATNVTSASGSASNNSGSVGSRHSRATPWMRASSPLFNQSLDSGSQLSKRNLYLRNSE